MVQCLFPYRQLLNGVDWEAVAVTMKMMVVMFVLGSCCFPYYAGGFVTWVNMRVELLLLCGGEDHPLSC